MFPQAKNGANLGEQEPTVAVDTFGVLGSLHWPFGYRFVANCGDLQLCDYWVFSGSIPHIIRGPPHNLLLPPYEGDLNTRRERFHFRKEEQSRSR